MRIDALELRIPPPVIAVLIAGAMWLVSRVTPALDAPFLARAAAAIVLAAGGLGIMLAGLQSFRRAQTTVNPLKPETSTSLVTGGIYAVTRNPMYLGMTFILLGWSAFLASLWALGGPVAFILYISRFQIRAEERVLRSLFGADYADYTARVRRWL